MPVAVCEGPAGFHGHEEPRHPSWHALEWHLIPSRVHRVLETGQPVEALDTNGFIVRPARSRIRLVAQAPTKFARFFTSDEFLRTVARDWLGEVGDGEELLDSERVIRRDPAIASMLDIYLRRALDQEDPATRLEMDSRAHLILLQLLKRHSLVGQRSSRMRRGGLAPHALKRVCELMTRDLAEDVPLARLAGVVGVSYHHFCHAFKASMGVAPRQWLVDQRVERACELLRTTRMSVTQIAAMVGYDDPNQLLRVFRGRRGTTPATYRREFLGRDARDPALP